MVVDGDVTGQEFLSTFGSAFEPLSRICRSRSDILPILIWMLFL